MTTVAAMVRRQWVACRDFHPDLAFRPQQPENGPDIQTDGHRWKNRKIGKDSEKNCYTPAFSGHTPVTFILFRAF
jgi:hypothetical protein